MTTVINRLMTTDQAVGYLVCPAWAKTCYLKGDNRK